MLSLRGQSDGQCGAPRLDCLPCLVWWPAFLRHACHLLQCGEHAISAVSAGALGTTISAPIYTVIFPPLCGAPSVGASSPGGCTRARPLLPPSWRRRCVLIIPGGGSTYSPGRRQSPPSPTQSRGLPVGTWGLLIIRYVCVAILPSVYYNN